MTWTCESWARKIPRLRSPSGNSTSRTGNVTGLRSRRERGGARGLGLCARMAGHEPPLEGQVEQVGEAERRRQAHADHGAKHGEAAQAEREKAEIEQRQNRRVRQVEAVRVGSYKDRRPCA